MRAVTRILLAITVILVSVTSFPRVHAESSDESLRLDYRSDLGACTARYNALLGQAKASILRGERAMAIDSLIGAKLQLRHCQELEERNSTTPVALALSAPPCACTEQKSYHTCTGSNA
jgi:hypothetical protein